MKKISKMIISALLCAGMMIPVVASAADFPDMPDNWTTGALERAIENGLLKGSDGMILPDNNIKRSEMAAIIVRAFGATKEADISMFPDVTEDKWYFSEFAKAVNMKAFSGTDEGTLNPESFITYQECFTVVARVFDLPESDVNCLATFDDASAVAKWAEVDMAKVVGNGYWEGIDNKLKPNDYITRAEFAVLMDNLVQIYINEAGTYTELSEGNILVRSNDVIIDGLVTDDVIFIGDGVTGKTQLLNMNSTNVIVVRGGTAYVTGKINNMRAICPGVVLDVTDLSERTGILHGVEGAKINLGSVEMFG